MILLILIPILIGWFFATRWLARRVTNRVTTPWKKQLAMWVIVPLFFLLPMADEIVGSIYMTRTCNAEGGYKFSQPLETVSRAIVKELPVKHIGFLYPIERFERIYFDADTNQEFGRFYNYRDSGGFLMRWLWGKSQSCFYYQHKGKDFHGERDPIADKVKQLVKAGETK